MGASFQDAWRDASVAWNAKRDGEERVRTCNALTHPLKTCRACAPCLVEPAARLHLGALPAISGSFSMPCLCL